MNRFISMLAGVGLLVAAPVFVVSAQDGGDEFEDDNLPCTVSGEGGCGEGGIGHHKTSSAGQNNRRGPDHNNQCYVCYQGTTEISWTTCHSAGCLGEPDPETREAYIAILRAAAAGNVREVIRLAPKAARYVSVNAERRSIQVRSCGGAIVANLRPARDEALAALSDALRRATPAIERADIPTAF